MPSLEWQFDMCLRTEVLWTVCSSRCPNERVTFCSENVRNGHSDGCPSPTWIVSISTVISMYAQSTYDPPHSSGPRCIRNRPQTEQSWRWPRQLVVSDRRQQMDTGQMENRRKPGDSIRQYKLCPPVVLTIFQTFADIPARKFCWGQIQQGNGKGGMILFSECSSVSWASGIETGGHNTWLLFRVNETTSS